MTTTTSVVVCELDLFVVYVFFFVREKQLAGCVASIKLWSRSKHQPPSPKYNLRPTGARLALVFGVGGLDLSEDWIRHNGTGCDRINSSPVSSVSHSHKIPGSGVNLIDFLCIKIIIMLIKLFIYATLLKSYSFLYIFSIFSCLT